MDKKFNFKANFILIVHYWLFLLQMDENWPLLTVTRMPLSSQLFGNIPLHGIAANKSHVATAFSGKDIDIVSFGLDFDDRHLFVKLK